MNKRNTRWISLVLSLAVMIGSIAYIAADANAEEDPATPTYLLMDSDHVSKLRELDDIGSSNADELKELVSPAPTDGSKRYVYSTVLRDDDSDLVDNATNDLDVYFDLFPNDGKTSIDVGDEIVLTATMENSTCAQDYSSFDEFKADHSADYPNAKDVTKLSFDLKYNADNLMFNAEKSGANIPMKFTQSGTGANAKITVTYPQDSTGGDPIKSYEMLYFTFVFDAKNPTVATAAQAALDNISIKPAELTVGAADPVDYTIYALGRNNTLDDLSMTYLEPTGTALTTYETKECILTPDFDPETTKYFVTLPSDAKLDLNTKNVSFIKADSGANVSVKWNGSDSTAELKTGLNRCDITVTPSNSAGTTRTYTIFAKKLTTDTLADPKTVLTKTVDYKEDGYEYTEDGTTKYADFQVQYTIDGVNDLLAPGNGYVISFDQTETDEAEKIFNDIVEKTANLDESVVVLDMVLANGNYVTRVIDGIGDPATLADIGSIINAMKNETGTTGHAAFQSINEADGTHDFNNIYAIKLDAAATDVTVEAPTAGSPYTTVTLPSADVATALNDFDVDNTVAEFVIIADYSSGADAFNQAVTLAMFGYPEQTGGDKGIPGYIKQIRDMLTNDSTAKVTLIALGAAGESGEDILAEDEYGIQINQPDPTYGVDIGSAPAESDNVYQSQTYILPLAGDNIWGSTAVESEQVNFDNYRNSFNNRTAGGNTTTDYYTRTKPATNLTSPTLEDEYDAAIAEANSILAGANNPHLIIITPHTKSDINTMVRSNSTGTPGTHLMQSTVANGIDTTIISGSTLTNQTDKYATAKDLYNQIVVNDPGSFICDPGDNTETTHLRDNLNSQIFWLVRKGGDTAIVNANSFDADISKSMQPCYDITWYKPAIGDYELSGKYLAIKRDSADPKLLENHYYPLSDTVDTKVMGATDSVEKDDIPTIALKYNEKYSLDVVKGVTEFKDKLAAEPDKSSITYVVTYENTGEETLTNVDITDSLVMMSAAADRKVYKLAEGKKVPASTDTPLAVTFTSSNDPTHPNKGEARAATSLAPGETIYLTYKIKVPEYTGVTTGTTSKDASNNTIYSYIIDNVATGTANELDNAAQVELKTDFMYSKSSGGTTPTSGSSSSTSTTSSTTIQVYPYNPNPSTGESRVGYIIAVSLLFGALGVFGVTIYGMVIDYKIEKARKAKYLSR